MNLFEFSLFLEFKSPQTSKQQQKTIKNDF